MDILKRQHTVISYLITCVSRAHEVVNRAAIGADIFPDSDCRATFLALLVDDAENDALLLKLACRTLPALKDFATMNAILALSANPDALSAAFPTFQSAAGSQNAAEDEFPAFLLLVLPSELRDNHKIVLSGKLCDNTAEISALFVV